MTAIVSTHLESVAKQLGVTLLRFDAASVSAVDTVLVEIARQRPEAVLVNQDAVFYLARSTIAQSL